jgi:dihydropteroate synthase
MSRSLPPTIWGNHRLDWGRVTHVMGILNITPDSFSYDGLLMEAASQETVIERVVRQAQSFIEEAIAILDVGGESTRPHAEPVTLEQEVARVVPVIEALRTAIPSEMLISIDTYKSEVARQALDAGASLVNDITGLHGDPNMAALIGERHVPVVLMANMRGYRKHDIVSDVIRYLSSSIDLALDAGIVWEHIMLDPGFGFGTTLEENLTLLRHLGALQALGRPILLGTSRKSTIGRVLGGLPPDERIEGTAATVALGIAQGADIVRVHDVHEMLRVVKMSDAVVRGKYHILDR